MLLPRLCQHVKLLHIVDICCVGAARSKNILYKSVKSYYVLHKLCKYNYQGAT